MNEFSIKIELSGNDDEVQYADVGIQGSSHGCLLGLITVMDRNAQFAKLIIGAARIYGKIKDDGESDSDG